MNKLGKEILEGVYYDLHYLQRYLSAVEEFLATESSANLALVKDGGQSVHEYLENSAQLRGVFPTILRSAALTTIYSSTESKLNQVCQLIEQRDYLPTSIDNIKAEDQSIRKARKYLVDVAHVVFPNSPEWQNLLYYQILRNCIVHNKGIINHTSRNNLFMETYKLPGLSFVRILGKSSRKIILHPGFCEKMIDNVRSFFEQLTVNL